MDLTNAFMCPDHLSFDVEGKKLVPDVSDFGIFRQLWQCALMVLRCADGATLAVHPGTGGLMGNPSIVFMFLHTYAYVTLKW